MLKFNIELNKQQLDINIENFDEFCDELVRAIGKDEVVDDVVACVINYIVAITEVTKSFKLKLSEAEINKNVGGIANE